MRWLHLSDFHTGKPDYARRVLFAELLKHIRGRPAVDMVFITGDIAQSGLQDQYRAFTDDFLIELREIVPSARFFMVPGNHDVDRGKAPTTVSYDHIANFPKYFYPDDDGLSLRAPSLERFRAYNEFVSTADLSTQRFDGSSSSYGLEVVAGGLHIGIIGLNTAWLSQDPKGKGHCSRSGEYHEEGLLTPGVEAIVYGIEETRTSEVIFVLGHHPLSWLDPAHRNRIRNILGNRGALYLHGHLHVADTGIDEVASYGFRSIQAGAAFNPEPGERWWSRVVWCEIGDASGAITTEAFSWSSDSYAWEPDRDSFPRRYQHGNGWVLPSPTSWTVPALARMASWRPPQGWSVLDSQALAATPPASDDDLLAYFDGALPTWRQALSPRVPRRELEQRLLGEFRRAQTPAGPLPTVRLITGAGGEGKSTILRQLACDLLAATDPWLVLWQDVAGAGFPADLLVSLPSTRCLIAADDAEWSAEDLVAGCKALYYSGHRGIHVALAARNTDWWAAGGDAHPWAEFSDFARVPVRGLTRGDARLVVDAWASLGDRGLAGLSAMDRSKRVAALVDAATQEASTREGSFLGAMFRTRYGAALAEHVVDLLRRLETQPAVGAWSLLDALLFVAAPHSANITSLSCELLVRTLSTTPQLFMHRVVGPLGDEAVITTTPTGTVLTRHRAIAEAVIEAARDRLSIDVGYYFERLVDMNYQLGRVERQILRNFNDFNFMSKTLREHAGDYKTAIRVAKVLVDREPTNRIYLNELGITYGSARSYALNALYCALSLTDLPGTPPVTNDHAKKSLAALGFALEQMASAGREELWRPCMATGVLGLRLKLDPEAQSHFHRYIDAARGTGLGDIDPNNAIDSIAAAMAGLPSDKGRFSPDPSNWTYVGLSRTCCL